MRLFKLVILGLATTALALPLTGCEDDGPAEEAGEAIDEAAEDANDAIEDAVDDIEDAVEDPNSGGI